MTIPKSINEEPLASSDIYPSGICPHCGQPCLIVPVDEGVGLYEYWGQRGNHSVITQVSNCCGEEITNYAK